MGAIVVVLLAGLIAHRVHAIRKDAGHGTETGAAAADTPKAGTPKADTPKVGTSRGGAHRSGR